jgi:hypothetical protein
VRICIGAISRLITVLLVFLLDGPKAQPLQVATGHVGQRTVLLSQPTLIAIKMQPAAWNRASRFALGGMRLVMRTAGAGMLQMALKREKPTGTDGLL